MLERVLAFSIRQRVAVILIVLATGLFGAVCLTWLPIDAVPDITNRQVQVNANAAGVQGKHMKMFLAFPLNILQLFTS